MSTNTSNDLLLRFLQATPAQEKLIDEILDGRIPRAPQAPTGPLLLSMSAGAKFLGVSRPTLWRMIRAGKLTKVEVLPGSYRLRRVDLEMLVSGRADETKPPSEEKQVSPALQTFARCAS